jgi:hypothetical protein
MWHSFFHESTTSHQFSRFLRFHSSILGLIDVEVIIPLDVCIGFIVL